ncbi:MAG TPA: D-erythronate dehydrogenase [Streptosporangiaceae bacterium]|nr:D-erythronate dehydrogenase [Streptosporangiaceae bacterium]
MTNVVITGGAGFLGARLARELLRANELDLAGLGVRPVSHLTLIDQAPAAADLAEHDRVTTFLGDLAKVVAADGSGRGALAEADVVFHLAAAVSGECEADFDLGMRANVHATESLLEACRATGTNPVVVYSSSVAVFGTSPDHPMPAVIEDDTLPNPQSSYGVQKFICEQMLADYTRKGFVRGRAIRLMTVSVRPGTPNGAASGFLSGIIREPIAGKRATCPVDPGTEVALTSPAKAIEAVLCAATATDEAWGGRTAVTMPALTMTVGGMVAALERVAGPEVSALIDWVPDPLIAKLFAAWPGRIRADRAMGLGLTPEDGFDSVIEQHVIEHT